MSLSQALNQFAQNLGRYLEAIWTSLPTRMSTSLMGTGTSRRSISSLELTYSCIHAYISVYFYLERMEGQRNRT